MFSNALLSIDTFGKTAHIVSRWKEQTFSFQMMFVSSLYLESFRSYARFSKVRFDICWKAMPRAGFDPVTCLSAVQSFTTILLLLLAYSIRFPLETLSGGLLLCGPSHGLVPADPIRTWSPVHKWFVSSQQFEQRHFDKQQLRGGKIRYLLFAIHSAKGPLSRYLNARNPFTGHKYRYQTKMKLTLFTIMCNAEIKNISGWKTEYVWITSPL